MLMTELCTSHSGVWQLGSTLIPPDNQLAFLALLRCWLAAQCAPQHPTPSHGLVALWWNGPTEAGGAGGARCLRVRPAAGA